MAEFPRPQYWNRYSKRNRWQDEFEFEGRIDWQRPDVFLRAIQIFGVCIIDIAYLFKLLAHSCASYMTLAQLFQSAVFFSEHIEIYDSVIRVEVFIRCLNAEISARCLEKHWIEEFNDRSLMKNASLVVMEILLKDCPFYAWIQRKIWRFGVMPTPWLQVTEFLRAAKCQSQIRENSFVGHDVLDLRVWKLRTWMVGNFLSFKVFNGCF